VHDRQQVLRLVVREVLVDTDSAVIQHTIPGLDPGGRSPCHLWGYRQLRHSPARCDPQDFGLPRSAFKAAADCLPSAGWRCRRTANLLSRRHTPNARSCRVAEL
jgi:hypothetical protein